ncbi:glycosyltransferase family 4 protein [Hymenobacter terrenus]|uniref:glycosyltransferase family 4 protein n=1 Tax=Hymenobacter terrenus TaxID=1629124 RepID=UPI00061918C7|nr:glycosyltransferase family 4 protein [Hymenobacter terrenus]
MNILQISPRVPFPLHDGGAIGIYNITAGLLQAGHRVTLLAANTPKHHQPAHVLDALGSGLRLLPVDVDTTPRPLSALRSLLGGPGPQGVGQDIPYNVERFISLPLAARLKQLLETEVFDVVQFEGAFVAWYAGWLRQQVAQDWHPAGGMLPPLVLRAHNVEYRIWETLAQSAGNPLKKWYFHHLATRMRKFERWMLSQLDGVAAITVEDQERLRELGCTVPAPLVPAGVMLDAFRPDPTHRPRPRTAFMIGSLNWLPNLEALDWLLREVWPTAHAEMPDLELHVAGTGTPAHLLAPRTDNVFIHGFVDSASDFMRQFELMVVPLLSGGGMRVKIIEGMALGKPILSTSLGAEGIAVRDGHDIVLRDGAAGWLDALRAWYRGELPVEAIGAEATRTAAEVYSNRRVMRCYEVLYEQVGAPVAPAV